MVILSGQDRSGRSAFIRVGFRQFLAFFGGSAVGLVIDLMGFQALLWSGFDPGIANLVSSTVSITAVYLLVSRYSFGASTRLRTYLVFVTWYGSSILLFSLLIQLASIESGWPPLVWKLMSVPVSFTFNYLFSRYLFQRWTYR